jgi:hypothetical protein
VIYWSLFHHAVGENSPISLLPKGEYPSQCPNRRGNAMTTNRKFLINDAHLV